VPEEIARYEPVIGERAQITRRDKLTMASEELPDWLAERIEATRMDGRHDALNDTPQ